jgi:hypothetical protein
VSVCALYRCLSWRPHFSAVSASDFILPSVVTSSDLVLLSLSLLLFLLSLFLSLFLLQSVYLFHRLLILSSLIPRQVGRFILSQTQSSQIGFGWIVLLLGSGDVPTGRCYFIHNYVYSLLRYSVEAFGYFGAVFRSVFLQSWFGSRFEYYDLISIGFLVVAI